MSGFKITNEDDISNFNLETSKKSNFLIQEESEEESKDQSAASPPPTEPASPAPSIADDESDNSEPEMIHRESANLFGGSTPSGVHTAPTRTTERTKDIGSSLRQQKIRNTAEQYGLYMNPEKHKPPTFGNDSEPDLFGDSQRRASSFSSYRGDENGERRNSIQSDDFEIESEASKSRRRSTRRSTQSTNGHPRRESADPFGGSHRETTKKRRSETEIHFRKKELLRELQELESKGYKLFNDYNIRSKLEDLENEVKLGQRYFEVSSLRNLGKSGFFTAVSLIERSTEIFNPMNLKLNGLYTQTLTSKDIIEHEIGAIVKKWVGEEEGVLPPEIKLLFILLGTIFMTHFSNHFSNHLADKLTNPDTLNKFNPDTLGKLFSFLPTMTSLFSGAGGGTTGGAAGAPSPTGTSPTSFGAVPSTVPSPTGFGAASPPSGGDLRPPPKTSPDIDELFSRLMPGGPTPQINPNPMASMMPQQTRQVGTSPHTAPTGRRTPQSGGTFGFTPSGVQRDEGSKEIDDSKRFVEYPSSESGASSIFSDSHRSAADSFGGSNTLTIKTKKAPRRRSRKKSTKKTLNIF